MCDLKQQPKITQDNVHLLLPSKVAQLANRLLQNGGLKYGVCHQYGLHLICIREAGTRKDQVLVAGGEHALSRTKRTN